ncbi:response regulator [Sphingomonas sp. JC676]|uniref:response regulator n=1 Tax=Sphingomonas sp. JC676 TaxID=2768065 RepID=UPI00223B6753|nr:response regulator [Sphingomonas sp. JC676]
MLLLVEDEPLVAEVAQAALTEGGYEVQWAASGAEAMAMLVERADAVVGLVTDIRLGSGIDGWEIARTAREMKAEIAVVYMTGDSAADWAAMGVPKSTLIQKPFAVAQIVTAISALLNRAGQSA